MYTVNSVRQMLGISKRTQRMRSANPVVAAHPKKCTLFTTQQINLN